MERNIIISDLSTLTFEVHEIDQIIFYLPSSYRSCHEAHSLFAHLRVPGTDGAPGYLISCEDQTVVGQRAEHWRHHALEESSQTLDSVRLLEDSGEGRRRTIGSRTAAATAATDLHSDLHVKSMTQVRTIQSLHRLGGAGSHGFKLHNDEIDQKLTLIVSSGWDRQRVTALSWQEIVIYCLKKWRFMWLWAPLALVVDFYYVTCIWLLFLIVLVNL